MALILFKKDLISPSQKTESRKSLKVLPTCPRKLKKLRGKNH